MGNSEDIDRDIIEQEHFERGLKFIALGAAAGAVLIMVTIIIKFIIGG